MTLYATKNVLVRDTVHNLMARQLVTGHSFSDDQKIAKGNSTHASFSTTIKSTQITHEQLGIRVGRFLLPM